MTENKLKLWKEASSEQKESYWAMLDNIHQQELIYKYNEENNLNYSPPSVNLEEELRAGSVHSRAPSSESSKEQLISSKMSSSSRRQSIFSNKLKTRLDSIKESSRIQTSYVSCKVINC